MSKKNFNKLQADYTQMGKDYQQSRLDLTESCANVQNLEQRLADAQRDNKELKQAYAAAPRSSSPRSSTSSSTWSTRLPMRPPNKLKWLK